MPLGRLTKWDLGSTFLLPFSIGLVYLLLGATIYRYKRTREAALACALCLVAAAFYLSMFDAHTTYRFTRVWLSYPLLGPLSVHLFAAFPEVRPRWARRRVLVPLYAVGCAVVAWRQLAIDDPRAVGHGVADVGGAAVARVRRRPRPARLHDDARRVAGGAQSRQVDLRRPGADLHDRGGLAVRVARGVARRSCSTADVAMVLSALFPALIAYAHPQAQPLRPRRRPARVARLRAWRRRWSLGVYFAAVAVASHFATILVGQSFAVALTLAVAVAFHPLRKGVQRWSTSCSIATAACRRCSSSCARCRRWRTCRRWPRWRSGRCCA